MNVTDEGQRKAHEVLDRIKPLLEGIDCETAFLVSVRMAAMWVIAFPTHKMRYTAVRNLSIGIDMDVDALRKLDPDSDGETVQR